VQHLQPPKCSYMMKYPFPFEQAELAAVKALHCLTVLFSPNESD